MISDENRQSAGLQLAGDSNRVLNYKRDPQNYITQLFDEQLPAIKNGFFNVHMTKGIIVQPHWHTNATEMVVLISGEVVTVVFDPFSRKLICYRLGPGQVSIFPKGWFHWIITESDHAHLLTVFDVPTPDIVYGSDFLRFVPKEVMQRAYCINEEEYARAVAPIHESVILGPPVGCQEDVKWAQANTASPPSANANGNSPVANRYINSPVASSEYANSPSISAEYANSPVTSSGYANSPVTSGGYANSPVTNGGYAGSPVLGSGPAYAQNLMIETLQTVQPWVINGLREAQTISVEHALREAAAVSYLIGKGYEPAAAHQIVESWWHHY